MTIPPQVLSYTSRSCPCETRALPRVNQRSQGQHPPGRNARSNLSRPSRQNRQHAFGPFADPHNTAKSAPLTSAARAPSRPPPSTTHVANKCHRTRKPASFNGATLAQKRLLRATDASFWLPSYLVGVLHPGGEVGANRGQCSVSGVSVPLPTGKRVQTDTLLTNQIIRFKCWTTRKTAGTKCLSQCTATEIKT